jgi:hypothetical protein
MRQLLLLSSAANVTHRQASPGPFGLRSSFLGPAVGRRLLMNEVDFRSARIVHNSKPFAYGMVLFHLPCSNSCPIITFQHGNVSSVADMMLPGLASANPLITFEQSNICVIFLYDSALDDVCEAVHQ